MDTKKAKKEILELLKKYNVVKEGDTGQLVIHLNDGHITKICKNVEVLRNAV